MRNPPFGNQNPGLAAVPTRESITSIQLTNILNVINTLNPFLLYTQHRDLDSEVRGQKLDGEAALAGAATFIKCCERIDAIMADSGRWDLKAHDELYASIASVHKAQEDFLKAQTEAAKELQRPSFQLKPTVLGTSTEYVAFWGDPLRPGAAIIGKGATPALALRDFDAAFDRTPESNIIAIAASKGIELEPFEEEIPQPPLTVKPTKKKGKK